MEEWISCWQVDRAGFSLSLAQDLTILCVRVAKDQHPTEKEDVDMERMLKVQKCISQLPAPKPTFKVYAISLTCQC